MLTAASFLLSSCTEQDLQSLCQSLWDWNVCKDCKAGVLPATHEPSCVWPSQSKILEKYFAYYRRAVGSYMPELLSGSPAALQTHGDLHKLILALKDSTQVKRGQFTEAHFSASKGSNSTTPLLTDQNRAVDLAIRIILMVNCAADDRSLALLESGVAPLAWRNDETLIQFFDKIFPQEASQLLNAKSQYERSPGITALLTATKLRSIARLSFEPTNDIRDHLRLDQSTGVVLVYHHVAFLMECLSASRNIQINTSVGDEVKG